MLRTVLTVRSVRAWVPGQTAAYREPVTLWTGDTHIITSVLLLNMITTLGPLVVLAALSTTVLAGDINRQSIIFNEKTPDVFYCPQVSQCSL